MKQSTAGSRGLLPYWHFFQMHRTLPFCLLLAARNKEVTIQFAKMTPIDPSSEWFSKSSIRFQRESQHFGYRAILCRIALPQLERRWEVAMTAVGETEPNRLFRVGFAIT